MDPILCIELYLVIKALACMEGYVHGRQTDNVKMLMITSHSLPRGIDIRNFSVAKH